MAIDLKEPVIEDEKLETGLENDLQPKPGEKKEEPGAEKLPFHQDPNVQAYIERQVSKRLDEGNKAWEDRMSKLEQRLSQPAEPAKATPKIGDWTPATEADAAAAKAIIQQAKQEALDELAHRGEQASQQQAAENKAFGDWLDELKVTSVLADDTEKKAFIDLIVKYKLEDKDAAVALWNDRKQAINVAKDEATNQGEKIGIKKAQEAKIGSARKGSEPGERGRSYAERRASEPNFDAIKDRELSRLGY